MWKLLIIVTLGFTLLFQINEIFALLQSDPIQQFSSIDNVKRSNKAKKSLAGKRLKNIQFYPVSPNVLPNLRQGYLFNEERSLLKKRKKTTPVNSVKIDNVFYAGSIIANNKKVALVFYEKQKKLKNKYGRPVRKRTKPSGNNFIYKKLNVSDSIGGYTVAQILPDRLILENDNSKLEKLLNEEDKPEIRRPPKTVRKRTKNINQNRTRINRKKQIRQPLKKSYNFKRRK